MKDALGSPQSVLVLGGGSDIAVATCRALVARRPAELVLAARKPEALEEVAAALRAAGASEVHLIPFDADDLGSHEQFAATTFDRFGDIDVVLAAFGVLGEQEVEERDGPAATATVTTNFTGVVSATVPIVEHLRRQGHGTIVLLSTVAGERVRRSNFVYGASKAGADAFFQGLGYSLSGSGVRTMIVRPGFVHTKMTAGRAPAPLSTSPEAVATAIVRGLASSSAMVWVPPPLRFVMSALRHLPRAVFARLPL
jgi:decaprenylphospho-beta-D-erythro-pentofuranosid-2-ulose 2-reductase